MSQHHNLSSSVGSSGEKSLHTCLSSESTQIVNGIRFDLLGSDDLLRIAQSFVECGRSHVVHFLAVDPTVRASRDIFYQEELNQGDLNIADGQPIAWTVRLKGQYTERIPGTEAVALLCNGGLSNYRKHYLYGSTERVSQQLDARLRGRYPGIRIVGSEVPPMGMPTNNDLVESAQRMRASGADFVWIGIGTPNQHHVARALRDLDAAPVILCVGAAFDFASGVKKRAPSWMQKFGLEWCHRLVSEPRRLGPRYLVESPRFVAAILREYIAALRAK